MGLGQESQSLSNLTEKAVNYDAHKTRYNKVEFIEGLENNSASVLIGRFVKLLKQKHKADIWYGTL